MANFALFYLTSLLSKLLSGFMVHPALLVLLTLLISPKTDRVLLAIATTLLS